MDWTEPSLRFSCSRLSQALQAFTSEILAETKRTALELLEEMRSCRVTLEHLRKVDAVEFVPSGDPEVSDHPSKSLDAPTAEQVKAFLVSRIVEYRASVAAEYCEVVPRDGTAFEAAFDRFVESCLGKECCNSDCSWFQEQVESGAGQPQLWKVFVVFQKQLREACEAHSKGPLPPPLFSTLPGKKAGGEKSCHGKKKRQRQRRRSLQSKSGSSNWQKGEAAGSGDCDQKPNLMDRFGREEILGNVEKSGCASRVGGRTGKGTGLECVKDVDGQEPQVHVAIIGPNGKFIPV